MHTRPGLRRLILGALLLLLLVHPVHGAPPPEPSFAIGEPCSGEGVYLYEDINYTGACIKFTFPGHEELGDDGWHDRASSIKFVGFNYSNGRVCATLYEHANFSGASTRFCGNDPWLGDDAITNDSADSIRVELLPLCAMVSEIPRAECDALVALFNSTDGPSWTTHTGWMTNYLPCSWYGVTCVDGHVTQLPLMLNNLTGTLPGMLGQLTRLEELVLHSNQLYGPIPDGLSSLSHLSALDLRWNGFTGSIPSWLGSLPDLYFLTLFANKLTGPIPDSLGSLSKMVVMELGGQKLTGTIPPSLGSLHELRRLDLSSTDLTGSIPSTFGSLAELDNLDLSHTGLSGPLPASLGYLPRLAQLLVSSTGLGGPLPASFTNLALTNFWFDNTQLCEPPDPAFQAWLSSIHDLQRTGVLCSNATPTATVASPPSPTPTRTRTVTPWPTLPGGVKRMHLPLLLRRR